MERIPSFSKNHDLIKPGLYECGTSHNVTTWDLRFKKPNAGDYIEQKALHTIEHLAATILRNGEHKDGIIYFGPMGWNAAITLNTTWTARKRNARSTSPCWRRYDNARRRLGRSA